MAPRTVKIWLDAKGDYLEVLFNDKRGYFRETASDQVLAEVDEGGEVHGFSISGLAAMRQGFIDVSL